MLDPCALCGANATSAVVLVDGPEPTTMRVCRDCGLACETIPGYEVFMDADV